MKNLGRRFINCALILISIFAVLSLQVQSLAKQKHKQSLGETLFAQDCTPCHADQHSNMIKPDKTIAGSKNLATVQTFRKFLSRHHGDKPSMPAYLTVVRNKTQLVALYNYLKALK